MLDPRGAELGRPGWGGQIIPRIDMEAIVSYLDGDPDKPVIMGLVPNPRQKVPYPLPENKTRSVFKTQTHKGPGFNELRFEDELGREEIFIHAQRDNNVIIENDNTRLVRKDNAEKVDRDSVVSVGRNSSNFVGNNQDVSVGGNLNINVGNPGSVASITAAFPRVTDKFGTFFKKAALPRHQPQGHGAMSVFVADTKMETVGVNSTDFVGGVRSEYVAMLKRAQIGQAYVVAVGLEHHEVVGKVRTIKAGDSISLICGKSRIDLNEDGKVEIIGKDIFMKGIIHQN